MSFLAPWTAVFAGVVAVPLLMLLYFLRMRRRTLRVASTLLWSSAKHDLQVNAPFARFRLSVLFLLQALVLALLLAAVAQPVVPAPGLAAGRLVLLLDRSASMNAPLDRSDPAGPTRLAEARRQARAIIASAARSGSEVLVASFARQPRLETGFERRASVLERAVDAIAPTDEEADLAAALDLAGSFAAAGGGDAAEVVVLSDGGVAPPAEEAFRLRSGRFRLVPIGGDAQVPNVGIVALSARRDFRDPEQVLLFARLLNAGAEPAQVLVTLSIDGEPGPTRSAEVPAATAGGAPGRAEVSFAARVSGPALLSVRRSGRDGLPADDVAAVALPAPSRARILLVHPEDGPDPLLERLLRETEPDGLRGMTGARFEQFARDPAELLRRFDLVVLDRVDGGPLPPVPVLGFGSVPAGLVARPPSSPGGRRILSWERGDPVMRHVALDQLVFAGFGAWEVPAGGRVLARGEEGPAIIAVEAEGARHVLVGFALGSSTWPVQVSVAIFVQNALEHLTGATAGGTVSGRRPGAPLALRAGASSSLVRVLGPVELERPVTGGERLALSGLSLAGRYEIRGAAPPEVALSVLSEVESDLRVRRSLPVIASAVAVGTPEEGRRPLWPWAAAAALAVLLVEWAAYLWLRRRA